MTATQSTRCRTLWCLVQIWALFCSANTCNTCTVKLRLCRIISLTATICTQSLILIAKGILSIYQRIGRPISRILHCHPFKLLLNVWLRRCSPIMPSLLTLQTLLELHFDPNYGEWERVWVREAEYRGNKKIHGWKEGPESVWSLRVASVEVCRQLMKHKH